MIDTGKQRADNKRAGSGSTLDPLTPAAERDTPPMSANRFNTGRNGSQGGCA